MDMVEVDVESLVEPALDYVIATLEGEEYRAETEYNGIGMDFPAHRFCSDWDQGGPVIDKYIQEIGLTLAKGIDAPGQKAMSTFSGSPKLFWADTTLVAAFRCIAGGSFGNKVMVPSNLINGAT